MRTRHLRQSQQSPEKMNWGFSFEIFSLLGLKTAGGKDSIIQKHARGKHKALQKYFSVAVSALSKPSLFTADFKDTISPLYSLLKNFFIPQCLGLCMTGSLFTQVTRIQKDSLSVWYQLPLLRESLYSPGSCVSVIYFERSQNGSLTPGQRKDASQVTSSRYQGFIFEWY